MDERIEFIQMEKPWILFPVQIWDKFDFVEDGYRNNKKNEEKERSDEEC